MRWSSILLSGLFLVCASDPARAWSLAGYKNIVHAASKKSQEISKLDNGIYESFNLMPNQYGALALEKAYKSKNLKIPKALSDVFTVPYFDSIEIPYYRNGFSSPKRGNLLRTVETFKNFAKKERVPELKLLLTQYATYYFVQAHFTPNTVSFYDHRSFFRGDDNGAKYCLSKYNPSIPSCRISVRSYWARLLNGTKLEVREKDIVLLATQTIIEQTADLAKYVYSTQPNQIPNYSYKEMASRVTREQASVTAARVVALWDWIYR